MSTALPAALEGLSDARAEQPEAPGKWSVRHVVQHLADSELVTGVRLRLVLSHDRPPLTPYDQDVWAERLRYREAKLSDAREQFMALRRANLRHWERLSSADLERVGLHGERGEESLDRMRRLVAGHDLLHLRQVARIRRTVESAPR
ncbi:MAG: DinB family protein, partial [Thermoanaerobaculia bacterium]